MKVNLNTNSRMPFAGLHLKDLAYKIIQLSVILENSYG